MSKIHWLLDENDDDIQRERMSRRHYSAEPYSFDLLDWLQTAGLDRLRPDGDEIWASCPFLENHAGKTDNRPSWSINRITRIWYCFSCKEGGSFKDLTEKLGVSPLAAEEVSLRAEMDSFKEMLFGKPKPVQEDPYWPLPDDYRTFEPDDNNPARRYLDSIGITWESIVRFGIGYGELTNNIIYPIGDTNGEVVAWQQRIIGGDYFYPTEPTKFQKSRYLYNAHAIDDSKTIYVVEGIKAAILLSQRGMTCVATFGSSMSRQQCTPLIPCPVVYLLYDGDISGVIGAERAYPVLRNLTGKVYVVRLPDNGKLSSPDDFPPAILEAAIRKAAPLLRTERPEWV